MRTFKFMFTIECAGDGTADLRHVEEILDLSLQELLMGEDLVAALDEKEAVTIQVQQIG